MKATRLTLEVYRGWIFGEATIVDTTSINTQRGDGIANVLLHPASPLNTSPTAAILSTTTGAGRTDISYINNKSLPHRPISSIHTSSGNADMYLSYRDAYANGLVRLMSKTFNASGLRPLPGEARGKSFEDTWTHSVGNKEGEDRVSVNSRGWTGLYF